MGNMAAFRGPRNGYKSTEKEKYREAVWSSFPKYAKSLCNTRSDAYALILPSSGGEEIETAIRHGIPENKIICVDENPAIIAASKWRKRHPKCKYYGCKISDVASKLEKDGRILAVANLDFCCNFSAELLTELRQFMYFAPMYENSAFAVTIARGRENKATNTLLDMVNPNEYGRVYKKIEEKRARCLCIHLFHNNDGHWRLTGHGLYTHNRHPMVWVSVALADSRKYKPHFKKLDCAAIRLIKTKDNLYWIPFEINRRANTKKARYYGVRLRDQEAYALNEAISDFVKAKKDFHNTLNIVNSKIKSLDLFDERGMYLDMLVHEALNISNTAIALKINSDPLTRYKYKTGDNCTCGMFRPG